MQGQGKLKLYLRSLTCAAQKHSGVWAERGRLTQRFTAPQGRCSGTSYLTKPVSQLTRRWDCFNQAPQETFGGFGSPRQATPSLRVGTDVGVTDSAVDVPKS